MPRKPAPMSQESEKTLRGLAIDPGTQDLGFAFFDLTDNRLRLIKYGSFRAKKRALEFRLHQIFGEINEWMDTPLDIVVSEQSFHNKRTPGGDTVRESLGIIKVAAVERHIPITLLRPSDAKWAVCGKIAASKIDVAQAVDSLGISLPYPPEMLIKKRMDHITDAIAIAIAYAFTQYQDIQLFNEKGECLCRGLSKPVPKKKRGTTGKSKVKRRTKPPRKGKTSTDPKEAETGTPTGKGHPRQPPEPQTQPPTKTKRTSKKTTKKTPTGATTGETVKKKQEASR